MESAVGVTLTPQLRGRVVVGRASGRLACHNQLNLLLLARLSDNLVDLLVALALQRPAIPLDNLVTCVTHRDKPIRLACATCRHLRLVTRPQTALALGDAAPLHFFDDSPSSSVRQRLAPDHLQPETRVAAILLQDQMSDEPCAVRAGLPRHRMLLLQERVLLTRGASCGHAAVRRCPRSSFLDARQRPNRVALDGTKAAFLGAQSRDTALPVRGVCYFTRSSSILCPL